MCGDHFRYEIKKSIACRGELDTTFTSRKHQWEVISKLRPAYWDYMYLFPWLCARAERKVSPANIVWWLYSVFNLEKLYIVRYSLILILNYGKQICSSLFVNSCESCCHDNPLRRIHAWQLNVISCTCSQSELTGRPTRILRIVCPDASYAAL